MTIRDQILAIMAFVSSVNAATAQSLTHTVPCGATRGKTTRITCYGSGLITADKLWTTFAATIRRAADAPAADGAAVFEIALPADSPVGMFGMRVANASGLSDLRLFVIDDLPVATADGKNLDFAAAQRLSLPIAVDGVMGAEQRHFYSITVRDNQRVAFEVVGNRFGVDFDPLVQIWTGDRKELVIHDNDEGLEFDCRFEHTFAKAGTYVVELRDTRYAGGGNFAYHLRMGDFPIARVAFPAGGQRGRWVSVAFPGRTATDVPPVGTQITPSPLVEMLTVSTKGMDASTWVPFAVDDSEQQLELEPNNDATQANAFLVPRSINGRLEQKGDVDCFRFPATKGQSITFQADTRRLASPADLYVQVLNSQGMQAAVSDDTGADDARLVFQAPADGTYTLVVEDINRRGGPEFVYRIEALTAVQAFSLLPAAEQIVVAQGSAVPIALSTVRTGYTGPIEVSVETTSDKLRCASPSFSAGQTTTTATVSAPRDTPAGIYSLRFAGAGTTGDRKILRGGDLTALLTAKLNNMRLLPPSVNRDIAVLVVPPALFALQSRLEAPAVGRYTNTPVTVQFVGEKYFGGDIALQFENLPPNITIASKPIPKGQKSIQLALESKANTPLGKFSVFVSGIASFQGRTMRVYSDILHFEIRPAFALTLDTKEVRIARGGKSPVAVQASRLPGYVGPISVVAGNLPKGVTAKPAQIAEKQTQTMIELSAAADAPLATVSNLVVTGSAQIGGQNESVSSPNVTLVVAEK